MKQLMCPKVGRARRALSSAKLDARGAQGMEQVIYLFFVHGSVHAKCVLHDSLWLTLTVTELTV